MNRYKVECKVECNVECNVTTNLFERYLAAQRVVILDGALATELEERGAVLDDPLWSAKILLESPELIRQVHYDYFVAGADVTITASYQASFPGLAARRLTEEEAADLMRLSVALALEARRSFLAQRDATARKRLPPLVAASVGPYGAYLHDGSEYTGDYGLSVEELMAWHRPRLQLLAASGADLLACETIPSLAEGEALIRLLAEVPDTPAWLSFSCRDGTDLCHGEPFADAVAMANQSEQIVAVGVNCTAPRHIESLLQAAARVTTKALLTYPNSGERWDKAAHCWRPSKDQTDFAPAAARWHAAGARLIGGCCRTGPAEIAALQRHFAA